MAALRTTLLLLSSACCSGQTVIVPDQIAVPGFSITCSVALPVVGGPQQFVFGASAGASTPGKLLLVNSAPFVLGGTFLANAGESAPSVVAVDAVDGSIYAGFATSPGRIVKASAFNASGQATRLGAITLAANTIGAGAVDPILRVLFVATSTNPPQVFRIALSNFSITGALALSTSGVSSVLQAFTVYSPTAGDSLVIITPTVFVELNATLFTQTTATAVQSPVTAVNSGLGDMGSTTPAIYFSATVYSGLAQAAVQIFNLADPTYAYTVMSFPASTLLADDPYKCVYYMGSGLNVAWSLVADFSQTTVPAPIYAVDKPPTPFSAANYLTSAVDPVGGYRYGGTTVDSGSAAGYILRAPMTCGGRPLPSASASASVAASPSASPASASGTRSASGSGSASPASASGTPSNSGTPSVTASNTPSPSVTPSSSVTASVTASNTPSRSVTPSPSVTASVTASSSLSASIPASPSGTASASPSGSPQPPSASPSPSNAPHGFTAVHAVMRIQLPAASSAGSLAAGVAALEAGAALPLLRLAVATVTRLAFNRTLVLGLFTSASAGGAAGALRLDWTAPANAHAAPAASAFAVALRAMQGAPAGGSGGGGGGFSACGPNVSAVPLPALSAGVTGAFIQVSAVALITDCDAAAGVTAVSAVTALLAAFVPAAPGNYYGAVQAAALADLGLVAGSGGAAATFPADSMVAGAVTPGAPAAPPTSPLAPPAPAPAASSLGLVIGVVVGAVLIVSAVAVGAYMLLTQRRRELRRVSLNPSVKTAGGGGGVPRGSGVGGGAGVGAALRSVRNSVMGRFAKMDVVASNPMGSRGVITVTMPSAVGAVGGAAGPTTNPLSVPAAASSGRALSARGQQLQQECSMEMTVQSPGFGGNGGGSGAATVLLAAPAANAADAPAAGAPAPTSRSGFAPVKPSKRAHSAH